MTASVGTLDLTQKWFPGDYPVRQLKLAGLKVVWNNQGQAGEKKAAEHICGSGDMEMLLIGVSKEKGGVEVPMIINSYLLLVCTSKGL